MSGHKVATFCPSHWDFYIWPERNFKLSNSNGGKSKKRKSLKKENTPFLANAPLPWKSSTSKTSPSNSRRKK